MRRVWLYALLSVLLVIACWVRWIGPAVAGMMNYRRAQQELRAFDTAVKGHFAKYGCTPSGQQLYKAAAGFDADLHYGDPWGNSYAYLCPGKVHPTGYDIICYGSDGREGGEGLAKDIILGGDKTLGVDLVEKTFTLCPQCKKKVGVVKTRRTTLSSHDAEKYLIAPNQYRPIIATETGQEICEACKEIAEAKTRLPQLLGKNKSEVAAILGTPDSSFSGGLGYWELTWSYEDRPFNYRTSVIFRGPWNNLFRGSDDFTHARVVNVQMEHTDRNNCPTAEQIIPSKLLKREPDRINARPAYNQLEVIWYSGKKTYLLDVAPAGGEKVFIITKKLDLKTGEVRDVYHSSGVNWRQCLALGFFQKNLHLKTGTLLEESPRIK